MPLTADLEQVLSHALGSQATIRARRPCAYRTSFPLEELDVELEDGTSLALVLKETAWDSLSPSARRAKPFFLHDPAREGEVYLRILAAAGLGTAACHGVHVPRPGSAWLFLERVGGPDLTQVGDFALWRESARWLARMHDRLRAARAQHLLVHDASLYARWLARAEAFEPGVRGPVAEAYRAAAESLLDVPPSFIHGELYASNVLVDAKGDAVRVCALDWELAAVGHPLLDLAALLSGTWSEEERRELAGAYRETLAEPQPEEELLLELDRCRLFLAVQWLGWSQNWTPPAERRHDWLGEARVAAARLLG